ncbi:NAD(P)/FAD-dependent oxidoreductase [Brachybacterium aquaticum]|uniref:NADPH-dependent 2,4-dienoyl-CoA reductase/sulfur reductase-like enzyme n=1 Tax=Brachybacterium aquaticum TaxID=1432564 RepID=A0A841AH17_9MICO|nr:FAD-dependent oxidoreductase [Brachybacterium aquaticum]MBB5832625.1 NADPH-dependent 2,4-dienoyl-CoA reductase/sulfur reductase-like enzyme [Brachybacterium aquaticum]
MTDLQERYDHVIIGGGIAADAAARAIREEDEDATIAILSADPHGPVYRPALSKTLWTGDDPDPDSQDLGTAEATGADLFTSTLVTSLLPASRTVVTARGHRVHYGTALLATGASARRLSGVDDQRVMSLRTVGDYRHLRSLAADGARVVVVGGGYIGTEVAAALTRTGAEVTLAHGGTRVLEHMLPDSLTGHLEEVFTDRGVQLVGGFRLGSIASGATLTLHAHNGETLTADAVVLGLGAELNTSLARAAKIYTDRDAVVVDPHLRTSSPHVFAAGDIALYDDALLGRRHVEHVDHAEASGAVAGRNMTRPEEEREVYDHTPLFFSDLFDDGYEAVGNLDTSLETVEVWNEDRTAAVVHYLDDGAVEGVLLWNTWDSVPSARQLIADSQEDGIDREDLEARIVPGG